MNHYHSSDEKTPPLTPLAGPVLAACCHTVTSSRLRTHEINFDLVGRGSTLIYGLPDRVPDTGTQPRSQALPSPSPLRFHFSSGRGESRGTTLSHNCSTNYCRECCNYRWVMRKNKLEREIILLYMQVVRQQLDKEGMLGFFSNVVQAHCYGI